MKTIKTAFPSLEQGFYDVFFEMIKDEGFSDQRLMDSVKHVIKTCVYPQPAIAQFLSYDQKVKLYTYKELQDMTTNDQKAFERFTMVRIPGIEKPRWITNEDFEQYNFEPFKK